MTVGVIITGSAAILILNASKQRGEVAARSELTDRAATAMECILRYVREIPQDECIASPTPCLLGNAQVTTAAASDLRFDVYGFRLSGGAIQITNDTAANWHTLAADATGLTLSYYDQDGVALTPLPLNATQREDIRRVTVQVTLGLGGQIAKLRSSIYLRNFMNEVANAP